MISGRRRSPSLSLMFFASDDEELPHDRYQLVKHACRVADQLDFAAVWMPERHFHQFGGIFPNPAVLAAAVATVTSRIRIRAGSVVLPLHDPIRVAEDWSMVDNLSHGRVDLAFATGWDADSFAFFPERYEKRVDHTFSLAHVVSQLWAGGSVERQNGNYQSRSLRIHPPPIQSQPGIWITATKDSELFRRAGAAGYNVLTALLFQTVDEIAEKVRIYRNARENGGFDPSTGTVTLMLHTYVAEDTSLLRQIVRAPLMAYLNSSVGLWNRESSQLALLDEKERDELLELAFERYLRYSSLIGDRDHCKNMLAGIAEAGIAEVACLIDFGLTQEEIIDSMFRLADLQGDGSL